MTVEEAQHASSEDANKNPPQATLESDVLTLRFVRFARFVCNFSLLPRWCHECCRMVRLLSSPPQPNQ